MSEQLFDGPPAVKFEGIIINAGEQKTLGKFTFREILVKQYFEQGGVNYIRVTVPFKTNGYSLIKEDANQYVLVFAKVVGHQKSDGSYSYTKLRATKIELQ